MQRLAHPPTRWSCRCLQTSELACRDLGRLYPRRSFTVSSRWHKLDAQSSGPSFHRPLDPPVLHPPNLDFRTWINEPHRVVDNAKKRKAAVSAETMIQIKNLYQKGTALREELSPMFQKRTEIQAAIQKNDDPENMDALKREAQKIKNAITTQTRKLTDITDQLLCLGLTIPNDSHPNAPVGPESAAVTLTTSGPPPMPYASRRDHVSVAQQLDLVNFEAAAMVTGSSWYYLMNEAALLETALVQYALKLALRRGFTPVMTPDVVKSDIATRCGFQPRDQGDPPVQHMYHLNRGHSQHSQLVLSGTAEIPLAGLHANKLYESDELPLKLVGLGKAFRSEAGARGAETRGLFRVHQFTKLELFVVCDEDSSETMMKEMLDLQMEIFEGLGLSIRVLDMPTEELGANAYRKIDIEAWMPGRGNWGEISSTSNCTDYQSRRLHIRYRKEIEQEKKKHVHTHTLNGTAVAIPRLIVALIENGARIEEGTVVGLDLPRTLMPFWIEGFRAKANVRWV